VHYRNVRSQHDGSESYAGNIEIRETEKERKGEHFLSLHSSSRVVSSPVAHRNDYRIRNKREFRAFTDLIPEARGGNHPPVVSEACLPVGHRRKHHECYRLRRPRPPCTGQPALCRPRDREAVRQGCTLTPEGRHHLPGRLTLSRRFVLLGSFSAMRNKQQEETRSRNDLLRYVWKNPIKADASGN